MGDEGYRLRSVAGSGGELEVHHHHLAELVEHYARPRRCFMTGWSRVATTLPPLNAIRMISWNESSGQTGSAINVSAVLISYAPSDVFDVRRTHCVMANSAPSRADTHHSSCLPSGSGIRTGQRNSTPCRLMAVKNVWLTVSPLSSGRSCGCTR